MSRFTNIVSELNNTVINNITSVESIIQTTLANFNATYVEALIEAEGGIAALAPYIQAIETATNSNST